jgi:hypothetical protein
MENKCNCYSNKETVLKIVKNEGYALQNVSDELRSDKEVVLAAVSNYGFALEFASKDLQNDKEVVLAALLAPLPSDYEPDVDNWPLYYSSINPLEHREILLAAAINYSWVLLTKYPELRNDKEILLVGLKEGECYLVDFIGDTLKDDPDIKPFIEKYKRTDPNVGPIDVDEGDLPF